MKKLILTLILLTLAVSFIAAQQSELGRKEPAIKQVQVTAKTISTHPAGKAYVLDLTGKQTRMIYTLAADIDYSHVQVRTSSGEMALKEVIGKAGASGRLLVGTPPDMLSTGLKSLRMSSSAQSRGGGNRFIGCDGAICICTGDDDCNRMLGPGGSCAEGSFVYCWGSGETAVCACVHP
jgi:hypothetical protein